MAPTRYEKRKGGKRRNGIRKSTATAGQESTQKCARATLTEKARPGTGKLRSRIGGEHPLGRKKNRLSVKKTEARIKKKKGKFKLG